jgi:hypothetical protein
VSQRAWTAPPGPINCRGRPPKRSGPFVCALRRATNFALDDLTFVVTHFLPHLNRASVWRILKAAGPSRRPKPASERPAKGQGRFRGYDLGVVHIDVKHLPKVRTSDGERRKRCLFGAIDRRSRSVHRAVKDDETEPSAIAFLRAAAAAFPFRLTHVLTDNGSCFTPAFARASHRASRQGGLATRQLVRRPVRAGVRLSRAPPQLLFGEARRDGAL